MLPLRDAGLPAALLCINGTAGNMSAQEAALLAWQLGTPVVVPMHFRLWAEGDYVPGATLDPRLLETAYRNLGGEGRVLIPEVGPDCIPRLP